MKKILALIICVSMLFTVGCTQNNTDATESTESDGVDVKVEILCTEILENYDMLDPALKDEKYVPASGVILEETTVTVNEGDGALDVLRKASEEYNIQIDISDGYAKSINYLYQKSCGDMSGWVYEVNNQMIMDEYTVTEGDLVTWKFICSFE